MTSAKLAIIQQVIATEDENTLKTIESVLIDDGISKISDALYYNLLQSQQNIESGAETTRERSEINRTIKETAEAIVNYQINVPGLWIDFLDSFKNTLDSILDNPNIYPEKRPPFKEAVMRGFPFVVVYIFQKEKITVHSVFDYRK